VPTHKDLDERANRTNDAATALIEAERMARLEKTQRLRALRLAEAGDPASKPSQRAGVRPANGRRRA